MIILGFITIYNVFIIHAKQTIFVYYYKDKTLFIVCLVFFGLSLLLSMGGLRNMFCISLNFIIGLVMLLILFYRHLYNQKDIPPYYNPLILLFYISSLFFFGFVITTFIGQTVYISSGFTIKQTTSIKEENIHIINFQKNSKLKSEYTRAKTFKERVKNILHLIKSDRGESLIIPERDLVEND